MTDAPTESKATFFRQSGWVALATVLGGIFLTAVHVVASSKNGGMTEAEYSIFVTLLRVQLLISIPAAGLQTMFAHQTAAVSSDSERRQLTATLSRVVATIAILWFILLTLLAIIQSINPGIYKQWNIKEPTALLLTLTIGLGFILLSALRGVLTGQQNFWGLGWTIMIEGAGRFIAVAVAMTLGYQATGGIAGVLIGLLISLTLAIWWLRDLPWQNREPVEWSLWLKRTLPLAIGPGVMVFMFSADVIFVQTCFANEQAHFYMPVATVGMAIFMFLTPMAIVMFPKLVNSNALGKKSQALKLALTGTATLGGLTVLILLLVPKLPLWVLYYNNSLYWQSGSLVPFYIGALYPLLLANLLISNLLAKERLGAWPGTILVITAVGYAGTLIWQQPKLLNMIGNVTLTKDLLTPETQAAFLRIIQIFGGFNLIILALSVGLTWRYIKSQKT